MSGRSAAALVDDLYRIAIEQPDTVDEVLLGEWFTEAVAAVDGDRTAMKALRRATRVAIRLARRYSSRPGTFPDWRNGVDEALGSGGWEPQLDLARWAWETTPGDDTMTELRERYRAVHFVDIEE